MKKIILLIILVFTNITFAAEDDINLIFNQDSVNYWQYISDRTMGGVSTGKAVLEKDGENFFVRLIGNVSTKNNGGFIQLRSKFSFANFEKNNKKFRGVRINVRGNGETYYIFIRTNEMKSYRDYYSASFTAKSKWEIIDIPFSKFKHRLSNNLKLVNKDILTFGIVAYGREFASDVSVSEITLYY